ncbi:MAG TPA: HAD hydrolase family protein [bacterium]|nr:HAD hydrolase family protein [bacterium]
MLILNASISLLVYDFDGVMTDNRALVFSNGDEAVFVNRSDGMSVRMISQLGLNQLIITSELNNIVKSRAKKLKIKIYSGTENKKLTLCKIAKKLKIETSEILYIGNDINDLEAMKISGLPTCPSDAHPSIKKISKYIFKTKGGYGVIRELYDLITHNAGKPKQNFIGKG